MKLKPRPLRPLFAALFLAAVTACLLLLLPEERTAGWFGMAFLVLLSTLGTLLFVINLLPGNSSLELTPTGMTVRSLYRDAFFAWTDIRGFFTESTYLGRQVHWKFTDDYRTRAGTRDLATRFTAFKATLPDTYGYQADQLIALLDEWRRKAVPAPATPTAAPTPEEKLLPTHWAVAGKTMTITLDPQGAEVDRRQSVALSQTGKQEGALAESEAAPVEARYEHATALLARARYPEALAAFDALLPEAPDAAAVHQARAVALYRLERWPESLAASEEAIRLRPDFAAAHHIRAGALHAQGKLPEALAACDDALALDSTNADTYLLCVGIFKDQGKFQEALGICQLAVRLGVPQSAMQAQWQELQPLAQYEEALGLMEARRYESALGLFEAVTRALPQFEEGFHRQGLALGLLGRHVEAVAAFNAALRINPMFDQAYTNRDAALFNLGRHEENIRFYEGFLAAHPDYAHGWCRLGLLFDSLGRVPEALPAFEQAARLRPEMATYHLSRGIALDRCGRPQEALAALNEALRLNPDSANAQNSQRIVAQKLSDQP